MLHFHIFLSFVLQYCTVSSRSISEAMDLVLRRKAIVAESSIGSRHIPLINKYPELKEQLEQLNILRNHIGQKSLTSSRNLKSQDWIGFRQDLEKSISRKETLESELASKLHEIRLERNLSTIHVQDITNALPDGSALIEFVRVDNFNFKAMSSRTETIWKPHSHYVAFVLSSKNSVVHMLDLGECQFVDKNIELVRKSIVSKIENKSSKHTSIVNNGNNYNSKILAGSVLRETIFDPLLAVLGDCKRLFIAPDGELNRLPFEILPIDNSANRYIIDDYQISYLTTGRDIMQFDNFNSNQIGSSVIAVDPDFNLETNDMSSSAKKSRNVTQNGESENLDLNQIHFASLPETLLEGKIIGDNLGVIPWTGDQVLESKIKACRSPCILHLATHGFFFCNQQNYLPKVGANTREITGLDIGTINFESWAKIQNPLLRSGLALAGANTWAKDGILPKEAEDGILTAEDVAGMDLTNTKLIVLSACDTGLGDVLSGEGVFGLRRAFVLAGAKTLVMSLWKVPDDKTRELILLFYEGLLEAQGPPDALRDAQKQMKERYPDNLEYWGGFICQGDPSPLTDQVLGQIRGMQV